jgi:hypothetical protein
LSTPIRDRPVEAPNVVADTLAERAVYLVSGDVACEENWPAIRDAILRRTQEAVDAATAACQHIADDRIRRLEQENKAFRQANASLYKSLNEARDLVHQLGAKAVHVHDNLEDEGDRVYLGSTNDADVLDKAKQLYDDYRWKTGDMGRDDDI